MARLTRSTKVEGFVGVSKPREDAKESEDPSPLARLLVDAAPNITAADVNARTQQHILDTLWRTKFTSAR